MCPFAVESDADGCFLGIQGRSREAPEFSAFGPQNHANSASTGAIGSSGVDDPDGSLRRALLHAPNPPLGSLFRSVSLTAVGHDVAVRRDEAPSPLPGGVLEQLEGLVPFHGPPEGQESLNVPSSDGLNRRAVLGRDVIGIVVSRADAASVSIGSQLRTLAEWNEVEDGVYRHGELELREFDDLHLELDRVATAFDDPEYVVVASKHSGETGPLLSAHFTGNFGAAEYGGSPRELVDAAPGALKHVLTALARDPPADYDVAMECTHHGPTDLGAPGLFVELGSGPDQWRNESGARAVAEAILSLDGVAPDAERTVVAFGGNHYAPQPTRLLLETDVAVGHVAADWSIEELGDPESQRELLEEMFRRSGAEMAVVDGEWPAVEAAVESLGYRVVSETWLRETSGVDPALVTTVEKTLGQVGDGVRMGAARASDPDRVELPADLVDACAAVDPERTVEAVHDHAVAYRTAENGNRIGDAALLPDSGIDALVAALAAVLETEYETVERQDGAVVAEREVFDPELAQDEGVPEGPLFGQLAAGETVTVDGETVSPEAVHVRETTRFDV